MGCFTSRNTFVSPVLKYLLFFFNFMFWLAGLALLAVGLWAHLEREQFSVGDFKSMFDFLSDVSIFFMITGCLIFLIGFCGCLGALRENTCLIKFYYYTIVIIFFAQVGGAIYIFLKSSEFKDKFVSTLKKELVPLYTERSDKKTIVDWIQEQFRCCGMAEEGYKDWNNNMYYNCTPENKSPLACAVPHSCCIKQDTIVRDVPNILCGAGALQSKRGSTRNINTLGCVTAVLLEVEANMPLVGGIVLGLALPQILGIVFSRTLDTQIADQLARWRRYNHIMQR